MDAATASGSSRVEHRVRDGDREIANAIAVDHVAEVDDAGDTLRRDSQIVAVADQHVVIVQITVDDRRGGSPPSSGARSPIELANERGRSPRRARHLRSGRACASTMARPVSRDPSRNRDERPDDRSRERTVERADLAAEVLVQLARAAWDRGHGRPVEPCDRPHEMPFAVARRSLRRAHARSSPTTIAA